MGPIVYTIPVPIFGTDAKHQIDLRQGMFSSIGFNGEVSTALPPLGYPTYNSVPFDSVKNGVLYDAGNLAIAYFTVIENAIGGNNGDYSVLYSQRVLQRFSY